MHLHLSLTTLAKNGFMGRFVADERTGHAAGLHTSRPLDTVVHGQHVSPENGQPYLADRRVGLCYQSADGLLVVATSL